MILLTDLLTIFAAEASSFQSVDWEIIFVPDLLLLLLLFFNILWMNNLRALPQLDEEKHDTHCYLDYLFYTYLLKKNQLCLWKRLV